ncbi:MAG TPA: HEAT repeat domain-containing protein [Nitrospiraceae bacterium]|nr:HEAT repeat domain-containing protein [Nitrospiraceae bacterium]
MLPPSVQVTVNTTSQLVTLDVKQAPLAAVLAAIGQQARITISVSDNITSERLSLAFQNVPLEEALKRVLAGQSYTFAYTHDKGREVISGVRLFAKNEQLPPTGAAPSGMPAIAQLTGRQGLLTPLPTTRSWRRGGSTMNEENVALVSDDTPLDELKRAFSETKEPVLRSAMLDAIANRGEEGPVAPALSTTLSDRDEEVRSTALDLLKSTFEPVPLGPLAQMAATDNNPDLRMEAMTLMVDQLLAEGRTKEEWAVAHLSLSGSLSDPNQDVREQAEMLLSELSESAQPTSKRALHRTPL